MLLKSKGFASVAAYPLEYAVTVKQTVIVYAYLGICFIVQPTVNVDFQGHDEF